MATRFQKRRDTAANWAVVNPVLAQGEEGLELDTGKEKVGNGTANWNSLPYKEWSADTISQAEAEAGTATTRRAFTAVRVFQAVAAWWAGSAAKTKLDGIASAATANSTDAQLRDRATHTGTQPASSISGLSTVATSGAYSDLSGRPGSTDAIPEGSVNLYHTTLRAAAAAPVQSVAGRTGSVTLAVGDVANAVATTDNRLSDARTPTTHNQAWSTITGTPTTLGGYGITDAVSSTDSRLSDARIPLAHSHGNITNVGAIGTTASLPIITTTSGVLTTGSFGNTAGTFCQGNDSRLSDARTPTAHNQAWSTITGTPTTLGGYGITDAFNPASPGAIGGTTPGVGSFTSLTATLGFTLPSGAPGSPATRNLYSVADTLRYRDSTNAERLLLNAADNLANLSNTATARTNLGAAASGTIGSSGLTMIAGRVLIGPETGTGAPREATLAGLAIVSNLLAALSDPVIALASPTAGPTAAAVLEVFGDFAYTFVFSSSTAVPVWSCDIGSLIAGAAIQLDIRISISGTYTSIYASLPTIAVGSNTSRNATGGTFSTAFINGTGGFTALTIPQGASVRFQCTQVPTTGGAGLKCQLIGRRAS